MAFLCPSRRGRQKKKHKEPKPPFLGRITGSSSVDTLVRVGLEKQHGLTPEARVCVTQDFLATTQGELSARRGDHVYRLYKEGDWVYVITELGQEGFVPAICLNDVTNKSNNNDVIHKNKPHSHGFQRTISVDGGKVSTPTPHRSFSRESGSEATRYSLRDAEKERKGKGFINASMQPDEGSDVSSSSHSPVSLRHQINPLPKPARSHSIPDVVSTTSDSVNFDSKLSISNNSGTKNSPSLSAINDTSNNSPKNTAHSKYSNSDKLYHGRTRQSSNVLELPLMKAGARDSHTSNGDSITEVKTFMKKTGRKVVVVFPFDALEENDLKVQKGEVVTVLNEKDPDWVWVKTKNGNEGFVPKSFICSIPDDLLRTDDSSRTKSIPKPDPSRNQQPPNPTKSRTSNVHDVRELMTLQDFVAQSSDDISVKGGEQVFADLANQIEADWLWVYAPGSQSYGYIPKTNVRWIPPTFELSPATHKSAIVMNSANKNAGGKPV